MVVRPCTTQDGIILGLLAAEITAVTGKDPGQHYLALTAQHGTPHYVRIDAPAGDPNVLKAWGLGGSFVGQAVLKLTPTRTRLGEQVQLSLNLQSGSKRAQTLAIDYAVHHVKGNGSASPKVFKGWVLQLPAGGTKELEKVHAMREITTRRYYAGRHKVTVQINGQVVAENSFVLSIPAR